MSTIETQLNNDELTIQINGRFDFGVVQDFKHAYSGDEHSASRYVVDLRHTEHMDSSALGMLLNMRKHVGESTNIRLLNCRPQIKKILVISRFDKKFEIQ